MDDQIRRVGEDVLREQGPLRALIDEVGKVIVGQQELVEKTVIGLLYHGHLLLEGVPGLAKTLLVRTLADCFDASFHRIQFTPDLLAGGSTGTLVFDPQDGFLPAPSWSGFRQCGAGRRNQPRPGQGPIGPARSHAGTVLTIGDETFSLPSPAFLYWPPKTLWSRKAHTRFPRPRSTAF